MSKIILVRYFVLRHSCGHDASYPYDMEDFPTLMGIIELERRNVCSRCWEKEHKPNEVNHVNTF